MATKKTNKTEADITVGNEVVSADTVKQVTKRTRKDMSWSGNENLQAGDNARYLRHALAAYDLPAIDISDEKQVEGRIKWYFESCTKDDMKPTVMGMANALGVDRRTLYDWSKGNVRGVTHSPIIKKAMSVLEALWEDYMQNGKINPVSGIFIGKNHFGYQDKQEVVLTPNNPLGEHQSAEQLADEYELAETTENSDNAEN